MRGEVDDFGLACGGKAEEGGGEEGKRIMAAPWPAEAAASSAGHVHRGPQGLGDVLQQMKALPKWLDSSVYHHGHYIYYSKANARQLLRPSYQPGYLGTFLLGGPLQPPNIMPLRGFHGKQGESRRKWVEEGNFVYIKPLGWPDVGVLPRST